MTELESENLSGAYPIDFIVQTIIEESLELFRSNKENFPNLLFGQLTASYLQSRYGQNKINEIAGYIRDTQIPVVQHWALVPEQLPCFSIQLMNSSESEEYAGLGDFHSEVITLDEDETSVLDRDTFLYSPIRDEIQIGIHNADTPDLTKYLYYFLVHTFITSKKVLLERGLLLTTWQATDISRINEYLPENVFSRFVNFTALTTPRFSLDEDATILTGIEFFQDDLTKVEKDQVPDDSVGIFSYEFSEEFE